MSEPPRLDLDHTAAKPSDRRLDRVLCEAAAAPDILTALGERLAPTDMQTLLLAAYRRRAASVTPRPAPGQAPCLREAGKRSPWRAASSSARETKACVTRPRGDAAASIAPADADGEPRGIPVGESTEAFHLLDNSLQIMKRN